MNDAQKEALRKVLAVELRKDAYKRKTASEVHAMLHAPVVTTVEHDRPIPVAIEDVAGALGKAAMKALWTSGNAPALLQAIRAQDQVTAESILKFAAAADAVDDQAAAAVLALFGRTEKVKLRDDTEPPLIAFLLSSSNLKACGVGMQWQDGAHEKDVTIKSDDGELIFVHRKGDALMRDLSMPNAIEVEDIAEAIAKL